MTTTRPIRNLTGKVALVTGASQGIGAEIARSLAGAGAAVTVNFSTSASAAHKVVADICAYGGRAIAVQGDVSIAADAARLVLETRRAFGRLDVLVNNAAHFTFEPLLDITEAAFHRHFNVNVLGPMLMTQQAVRQFEGGGCVINVGSAGILTPGPNSTLYAASKAALDMMTMVLAKELGPKAIRVNGIRPGATQTEGNERLGTMSDPALVRLLIEKTALRRFGQPSDIAPVVVFLASDDAAWITGEVINVSGGFR